MVGRAMYKVRAPCRQGLVGHESVAFTFGHEELKKGVTVRLRDLGTG